MFRIPPAIRVLMGVALLLAAPLHVEAQTPADGPTTLEPGTRVRVTYADTSRDDGPSTRLVGQVERMDLTSLHLVGASESTTVPQDAIVRLERSVRPSGKTRGALIGFGVGFAAMFTLATIVTEGDCFRGDGCLGGQIFWSAILATPAAAVGAIVAPSEQWMEVPLPRPTSSRAPTRALSSSREGLQLRMVPVVGRHAGVRLVGSF